MKVDIGEMLFEVVVRFAGTKYCRLELLGTAAACLCALCHQPRLIVDIYSVLYTGNDGLAAFDALLILALFFMGMALALFYGLKSDPMSEDSKGLLIFFIISVHGGVAFWAGSQLLESGWLMIFALINFLKAGSLILMFRFKIISKNNIEDKTVSRLNSILLIILVFLFYQICSVQYGAGAIEALSMTLAVMATALAVGNRLAENSSQQTNL